MGIWSDHIYIPKVVPQDTPIRDINTQTWNESFPPPTPAPGLQLPSLTSCVFIAWPLGHSTSLFIPQPVFLKPSSVPGTLLGDGDTTLNKTHFL